MTFSKMFLDLALHDNVEITESMIENMACLEEHWNTVEFELKFEITEQCNLNCSFCHQEFGKREKNCTNFDLQSYVKIIGEAKKESQIKHIRITGGEPLLHPDLKSFLACAKDAGFSTILNTNATLLTPQKIKDLSPLISLWKISLPSFNKSDTDIITGIPQTWEKKLSSLSRLANAGCNIDLLSVCSIRHDFCGGCRDSAEGGVLLSCLSYMERLSVCIYRIYGKRSSSSKNLRIWCFLPMF